jgi:imidazolonepropionase-like amidohydrolase
MRLGRLLIVWALLLLTACGAPSRRDRDDTAEPEAAAPSGGPAAAPGPLLLAGARILDAEGSVWLERDVLVVDGRIDRIDRQGRIRVPDGTRRVDLSELRLLPGLIDLHAHLLLHPYDETPWNDQVLREALELRTLRAGAAARRTLEAGFTTVRELGTEGAAFADVALRDAIERGIVPGPRVLASTRAIVATSSYGPSGFDPRFKLPKGAQEASGVAEVRRAVREQVAAGADWIKVYADYRRRPGAPSTPTFSQAELDALVDEATAAGLPVAAHAVTDEAIRRAVAAGVKTIEHGSGASTEVLTLMKDGGVVLCPTLAASEAIARYAGWEAGQPEPQRVRESREMFERALAAGVTIAMGSDAGVFAHGDNVRELVLMVDYGMRPPDALRAATSIAAAVLGRGDDLGRVAKDHVADLIAVREDPLEDVTALRAPAFVMQGGRIVVRPDDR